MHNCLVFIEYSVIPSKTYKSLEYRNLQYVFCCQSCWDRTINKNYNASL